MEETNRSTKASPTQVTERNSQRRANHKRKRSPFSLDRLSFGRKLPPGDLSKPGRRSTAKQPASSMRKPPPVVARGYNVDIPWQDAQLRTTHKRSAVAKTTVRRRFDVPIGAGGAEMRLPSMPVLRVRRQWIIIACLAGFTIGLYFLWRSPIFRVEALEIQGLQKIRSSDVSIVLDVAGKSIFQLRPSNLEQKLLQAYPEFSSVQVLVKLPNDMTVQVSERTPVLTWRQPDGVRLVAADGFGFPMRLDATQVISPVVEASGPPPGLLGSPEDVAAMVVEQLQAQAAAEDQGEDGQAELGLQTKDYSPMTAFMTPEMVQAIFLVAEKAPPGAGVLYDSRHGLGWNDPAGWKVYLGNGDNMAMKLFVYDAIVARLQSEGRQPELISVEYVHNPYFQLAPESDDGN